MSLYIVRWPDLSASLVQAEDENDLLDILDQVGNPDDCEWSVYTGALFIDFRLPVKWSIHAGSGSGPIAPPQIVIEEVGPLTAENVVEAMQLRLAEGDDGYDTGSDVLQIAFPRLHAAVEASCSGEESPNPEGGLPEAELHAALHAELERFLQASWRRAQIEKKTDAISRLAYEMDLSLQLAHKYERMARQNTAEDDEPDPPEDPAVPAPPLFRVSNHHGVDCAKPEAVDGDEPGKYHGYFVNEDGEQATFVYDHAKEEALVRIGSAGWNNAYRVVEGRVHDIAITESEAAWIRACWLASRGNPASDGWNW